MTTRQQHATTTTRLLPLLAGLTALALTMTACSSTPDPTATPQPASASAGSDSQTSTPNSEPDNTTANETTDAERSAFVTSLVAAQLPVEEAEQLIVNSGYTFRQGPADGEILPLTADYQENRITVVTTDGIVTGASWG